MKFGVQLYGPLSSMSGSTLERLGLLAQAGIGSIGPCISDRPIPGMESVIWPIDWLGGHADKISGLGFEIPSAHVFAENLAGVLDTLKDLAAKTGIVQYVVKTPAEMDELSLQRTALTYMRAADELAGIGVDLLLHNEARDIQTKIAGKTAYERLLDLCMGKVYAQVDVGWVWFGGENPAEFLMRNAWRVRSVHHKDFGPGTELVDVPVGTGNVDLAACFRFAQHRDIPQLVDQEHFGPDVPGELAAACGLLNGFAYCAFREIDGRTQVDVYTVLAGGGKEKRLTEGGFNDGPEYSPDGRHIWFNSTRSGLMQIWRMERDGGGPTQITKNQRNNWFAHLSPDGKRAVYLSYGPRQLEPQEHLPNMPVELWMMDADGGNQHRILSLFGGQGTINVNSWARDSRRFAFVSYFVQEHEGQTP